MNLDVDARDHEATPRLEAKKALTPDLDEVEENNGDPARFPESGL